MRFHPRQEDISQNPYAEGVLQSPNFFWLFTSEAALIPQRRYQLRKVRICRIPANQSVYWSSHLTGESPIFKGKLTIAWSSCPSSVQQTRSCLNTTDWRMVVPVNTKLTIWGRRASTVFDRFNFTIIDIIDFSDPTPVEYTPDDLFLFYNIIFAVNQTQENWWLSTQYLFLLGVTSSLTTWPAENGTGSHDQLSRLQEFLATPIFLFNNVQYGGPITGLGTSASLVTQSYRVLLTPSLYSPC